MLAKWIWWPLLKWLMKTKAYRAVRRKFLIWLMRTPPYKFMLKHVIPYLRFKMYYTNMKGYQYRQGYEVLRPGHIIVTIDYSKLTTMLIGGTFTHAAQCVGKGGDWEISEMTHTDYTKSTFFDICKESDRVVILECPDWTGEYLQQVINRCKNMDGAKYDQEFALGLENLYCSELVYLSDIENRMQASLDDLADLGRPYISPTGLYKARNVRVVWDSDKCLRT